ncbi:MAG: IS110 family transposase [Burkholderiales bacterium]
MEKHRLDSGTRRYSGSRRQCPLPVKNLPGRKTDRSDSEWLAQLGRFGLVKPSFIPPQDLRELRVVSRYRQKVSQTWAGENRLHKVLD